MQLYVQVADGVIDLEVDDIQQRSDLRERGAQRVEQRRYRGGIIGSKHHHHHHLACRCNPHHHIAQQTLLSPQVIKRESMLTPIILDKAAQAVRQVILEVTLLNVEHLVKSAGDVKTGAIAVVKALAGGELLVGEPLAIRESIFHLIAIFPYLF